MNALLVNQSPVSSITYSNKMRVIYDGVEQDAELRKYPSGKIYFRTENAHFVPVNEVGVMIPLTQGKSAIVDFEDYEHLMQWKWCTNGSRGYAYRTQRCYKEDGRRSSKGVLMHRFIMKSPKALTVDHIDNNKLNNRRNNLRICTDSENKRNAPIRSNNKSGFKGVHWNKGKNKWKAHVSCFPKKIHIGYFTCKIEAARAYNEAALKHHGEFARLNIIPNG